MRPEVGSFGIQESQLLFAICSGEMVLERNLCNYNKNIIMLLKYGRKYRGDVTRLGEEYLPSYQDEIKH